MSDGRLRLSQLELQAPSDLLNVPLEVGVWYSDPQWTFMFAEYLHATTKWQVRPFAGFEHAAAMLAKWTPHIFVTHWHDPSSHRSDNLVSQIAERLRASRGGDLLGDGPFLIASYRRDSSYFHAGNFLSFIHGLYDYALNVPFQPDELLNVACEKIYAAIKNERRAGTGLGATNRRQFAPVDFDAVLRRGAPERPSHTPTLRIVPRSVAFLPDEKGIAFAARGVLGVQVVHFSDPDAVSTLPIASEREVEIVAIPAGRDDQIAVGGFGEWSIHDLLSGAPLYHRTNAHEWITALEPSPDGRWWAVESGSDVLIFDSVAGTEPRRLPDKSITTQLVRMSSDGSVVAYENREGRIQVYNVTTGKHVCEVTAGVGRGGEAPHLSVHQDQQVLDISTGGVTLKVHVQPQEIVHRAEGAGNIDFSPITGRFALLNRKLPSSIRTQDGRNVELQDLPANWSALRLGWSCGGRYFAIVADSEGWIRVWDTDTGRCVVYLPYS